MIAASFRTLHLDGKTRCDCPIKALKLNGTLRAPRDSVTRQDGSGHASVSFTGHALPERLHRRAARGSCLYTFLRPALLCCKPCRVCIDLTGATPAERSHAQASQQKALSPAAGSSDRASRSLRKSRGARCPPGLRHAHGHTRQPHSNNPPKA